MWIHSHTPHKPLIQSREHNTRMHNHSHTHTVTHPHYWIHYFTITLRLTSHIFSLLRCYKLTLSLLNTHKFSLSHRHTLVLSHSHTTTLRTLLALSHSPCTLTRSLYCHTLTLSHYFGLCMLAFLHLRSYTLSHLSLHSHTVSLSHFLSPTFTDFCALSFSHFHTLVLPPLTL